jgi:hypothetical protein
MIGVGEGEEFPEVRLDGACLFEAADASIQEGEIEMREA